MNTARQTGRMMHDPETGDMIEFLETSEEPNGKSVKCLFTVKPGGFTPVGHLHLFQDEAIEILSGRLNSSLRGRRSAAGRGEIVLLAKAQPHEHYNAEGEDLVMMQTISPALDADLPVENIFGLAGDGRPRNGQPEFLQVMVRLRSLQSKTSLAKTPVSVQNAVSLALAPVARALGDTSVYARYSGMEL